MYEIRLHGRGGQGAVMAAGMLATGIVADGKFAVAIPSFGFERRDEAASPHHVLKAEAGHHLGRLVVVQPGGRGLRPLDELHRHAAGVLRIVNLARGDDERVACLQLARRFAINQQFAFPLGYIADLVAGVRMAAGKDARRNLDAGNDRFTADGMDYDNLDQVLQLRGRVRGMILPGKK